jgi:hypothetical protein
VFFFRRTRCKNKFNSYEFHSVHLRPPQYLWLLPRKVIHKSKCSFTMQGPVAEWLRPQVRIARNDYLKWSLRAIKHLLLSEVGSKPARVAFLLTLQPRASTWIGQRSLFVVIDLTANPISTNYIVLHLRTPQHLLLLPRKVTHKSKFSFTMQGPVAEWLRPQVRIARNDYLKRPLETIRHLLLSLGGGFETCQSCFFIHCPT